MAHESNPEERSAAGPESCRALLSAMENAIRMDNLSQMQFVLPKWRTNALATGYDASEIIGELKTLLFDAARWNRSEMVSYIICSSGVAVPLEGLFISIAVEKASFDTLEVFLEHGWSINLDDSFYPTPLITSIAKDNFTVIHWLLDHGADPNVPGLESDMNLCVKKSVIGRSISYWPLDVAARHCSSPEVFEMLLSRGAKLELCNPLHAVSANAEPEGDNKQLATIDFLLSKGLDINKIEFEDNEAFLEQYDGVSRTRGTPLHYAAWSGNVPVARHLIDKGAKRDALDSTGDRTPLQWAEWDAENTEYPVDETLRALLTGNSEG
ncbi:MAG: hypothetical protein Q9160_007953 [Pyrenula sp. 1 TL-2023]